MKTATSPSNFYSRCGGHLASFMALALAALLGTAVAPAQAVSSTSRLATPAASGRPQAAVAPARHGEEEESGAKPNDASHQGIKIHGHWKIDIKNADGSLASTHEFENSLQDGGSLFSYLLTSRATSGEAAIQLDTSYGASNCLTMACYPSTHYVISELSTGYWATDPYCANYTSCAFASNLNVSISVNGSYQLPPADQVVLSGSVVANSNVQIMRVTTAFAACSSATGLATVTPAQCHTGTVAAGTSVNDLPQYSNLYEGVLTGTTPSAVITVLSGQTIQVTVTLSFS